MNSFLKRIISGLIFLIIFWSTFVFAPSYFSYLLLFFLLEILIIEWKNFFKVNTLTFWVLMPIYPILPFILMILLNKSVYRVLLLTLFILVFCFDSGSYIFGNILGKNKILPKVSPGKTWEGFIGGTLFTGLALFLILLFLDKPINKYFFVLVTLIVSILALLGDLFESWLKRRAKIKDSGYLMPGHGGFLDRFDGIMFVAIFFYVFRDYLIKYF